MVAPRVDGNGLTPPGQRTAVATDEEGRRCAFERCQAGGDILPRAPRVSSHTPPLPDAPWYHPGCWFAERRQR